MEAKHTPIPAEDWEWGGYPAHFCLSEQCRFHMTTRVGEYLISTVGDMWVDGKRGTLGASPDSWYETYVFECKGPPRCDCAILCMEPRPSNLSEIDGERSATPTEARSKHMAMCRKYAAIRKAEGGGE